MTTYKIIAPHFVAAVIASGDVVYQSAPILHWAVGRSFSYLRDYSRQRGWTIEPLDENTQPVWLEYDGLAYELCWHEETLARITLHENGETRDLTYDELPEQLKKLL